MGIRELREPLPRRELLDSKSGAPLQVLGPLPIRELLDALPRGEPAAQQRGAEEWQGAQVGMRLLRPPVDACVW